MRSIIFSTAILAIAAGLTGCGPDTDTITRHRMDQVVSLMDKNSQVVWDKQHFPPTFLSHGSYSTTFTAEMPAAHMQRTGTVKLTFSFSGYGGKHSLVVDFMDPMKREITNVVIDSNGCNFGTFDECDSMSPAEWREFYGDAVLFAHEHGVTI